MRCRGALTPLLRRCMIFMIYGVSVCVYCERERGLKRETVLLLGVCCRNWRESTHMLNSGWNALFLSPPKAPWGFFFTSEYTNFFITNRDLLLCDTFPNSAPLYALILLGFCATNFTDSCLKLLGVLASFSVCGRGARSDVAHIRKMNVQTGFRAPDSLWAGSCVIFWMDDSRWVPLGQSRQACSYVGYTQFSVRPEKARRRVSVLMIYLSWNVFAKHSHDRKTRFLCIYRSISPPSQPKKWLNDYPRVSEWLGWHDSMWRIGI